MKQKNKTTKTTCKSYVFEKIHYLEQSLEFIKNITSYENNMKNKT